MAASTLPNAIPLVPPSLDRSFTDRRAVHSLLLTLGAWLAVLIASTSAAGSRPGPLSWVPKNGMKPSVSCSQLATGRISGMTTKMPHRPKTTLGIAASISTMVRNTAASRAGRKSWVRKTATVMPKKPPINSASSEL